jgi:hypothetical protein
MTGSQLARYLGRRTYALASSTRPDGRAHAAPTLFTLYASAFWLPTIDGAARLGNVRAHPWLALSIIEGEHDTHAAVLTEGPAEVLPTARKTSRALPSPATELAAWTGQRPDYGCPQRLFSFAERAWEGLPRTKKTRRPRTRTCVASRTCNGRLAQRRPPGPPRRAGPGQPLCVRDLRSLR